MRGGVLQAVPTSTSSRQQKATLESGLGLCCALVMLVSLCLPVW